MNPDDFYAAGPVTAPPAPPAPPAPLRAPAPTTVRAGTHRRSPWLLAVVGVVLAIAAAVTGAVVAFSGGSGSNAGGTGGNVAFARTAGHVTGVQLPMAVAADDCRSALTGFPQITTAPAKSAFVGACLSAHGTTNYNPLRDLTGK